MTTLHLRARHRWTVAIILLVSATNIRADFALGVAAYNEGDFAKAAVEFLLAADKGDVRAQLNLGLLYDQGQGIEQDHTQAAKWYTRAADNGDDIAQANLAAMYFQGLGVEQSDQAAGSWYEQAARSGNALAQYNLAVLYEAGIGVAADPVQSYAWLEIAKVNGAEVSDEERSALSKQLTDSQRQTAQALVDAFVSGATIEGEGN